MDVILFVNKRALSFCLSLFLCFSLHILRLSVCLFYLCLFVLIAQMKVRFLSTATSIATTEVPLTMWGFWSAGKWEGWAFVTSDTLPCSVKSVKQELRGGGLGARRPILWLVTFRLLWIVPSRGYCAPKLRPSTYFTASLPPVVTKGGAMAWDGVLWAQLRSSC